MNMDHVEFDREPPANLTTMVMAYGGWIDAGQAATGALRHLVRDLSATRLARIDPEPFFAFTQERPDGYFHDRPGRRGATWNIAPRLDGASAPLPAKQRESRGDPRSVDLCRPPAPLEPGHVPLRRGHQRLPHSM